MKQKITFAYCLFLAFGIVACGQKGTAAPGLTETENRVFFLTSDYNSSASYLYSFNTATSALTREAPSFFSGDVIGFQDAERKNFYIGERFSAQALPTRLTRFEPNGNVQQNSADVPVNLHDAILFENKLYYVGYDNREVAMSLLDINYFSVIRSTVNGFSPQGSDSTSFEKLLVANQKPYVLTVGYQSYPEAFTGAKLLELAPDLVFTSPEKTWSVRAGGEECWDLYTAFRLTPSRMVVACNPSYANNGRALSVFLIDMFNDGPFFTLLKSYPLNGAVKNVTLGGASKDANMIFITEDDGKYQNPKALQSYWFNVSNPQQEPLVTQGAAFLVEYNQASNQYIYSCATDAESHCKSKAFTVSPATLSGAPSATAQEVFVPYVAGHVQFFHDL